MRPYEPTFIQRSILHLSLALPRWTNLILAACLVATATAAGARAQKPGSMAELASQIAERLPHNSGMTIYVAMPAWKGHATHYPLCKTISKELGQAVSAAEPDDKIYSPAQAAGILATAGVQPLDVYFTLRGNPFASQTATMIGAALAVTSIIESKSQGILLTVEATQATRNKRLAKLSIFLDSPHLRTLLSLPDTPVKDTAGVYEAGVGGVGLPQCLLCPNPKRPKDVAPGSATELFAIAFTVGVTGTASDAILFDGTASPKINQAVLAAVRSWRFKPALGPGGEPVPVRMLIVIQIHQGF